MKPPPVNHDHSADDAKLADLLEERYARLPIETIRRELHRDQVDITGTLLAVDAILAGREHRSAARRSTSLLKIGQIAAAGLAVAFFVNSRQVERPPSVSSYVTRGHAQPNGQHHPLLIARAGTALDPDLPLATTKGGAWLLGASDLDIGEGKGATKPAMRTTKDFSWLPNLSTDTNLVVLSACASGLSTPRDFVAARFHPGVGRIVTHSFAHGGASNACIRPFTGRHLLVSWVAETEGRSDGVYFAPEGNPIWAVADGVVSFVGETPKGGKCIWLTTETGTSFYYQHLDRGGMNVHEGMEVRQGDLLGYAEARDLAQLPGSMLHIPAHGAVHMEGDRFPETCTVVSNRQASGDPSLPWDQQIRSQ